MTNHTREDEAQACDECGLWVVLWPDSFSNCLFQDFILRDSRNQILTANLFLSILSQLLCLLFLTISFHAFSFGSLAYKNSFSPVREIYTIIHSLLPRKMFSQNSSWIRSLHPCGCKCTQPGGGVLILEGAWWEEVCTLVMAKAPIMLLFISFAKVP